MTRKTTLIILLFGLLVALPVSHAQERDKLR